MWKFKVQMKSHWVVSFAAVVSYKPIITCESPCGNLQVLVVVLKIRNTPASDLSKKKFKDVHIFFFFLWDQLMRFVWWLEMQTQEQTHVHVCKLDKKETSAGNLMLLGLLLKPCGFSFVVKQLLPVWPSLCDIVAPTLFFCAHMVWNEVIWLAVQGQKWE